MKMETVQCTSELCEAVRAWLSYFEKDLNDAVHGMTMPRLVTADLEERSFELAYTLQPWMRNPAGVVHGGITATLLDQTMGLLVGSLIRDHGITPTINLNVSYLRTAPIGITLHVRARALYVGRNIATVTAEAFEEGHSDTLIASASGSFYTGGTEGRAPVTAQP